MRVVCIYFQNSQDTKSIAEIFYRATPQIVLRKDQAIFLEISKCKGLYSEEAFLARTRSTLKKLNIEAKIAAADDIPTALSFAVYGINQKNSLPIESLEYFYNPLLRSDEPIAPIHKIVSLLKGLGIHSLSDFLKLSQREISNRFGSIGLTTYMQVLGQWPIVWENFIPSPVVCEKFEFDPESPVENLEPIYFRLKSILDKIILRLKGKGKRLKQFDVLFKQEHSYNVDNQYYKVSIHLQLPYISNKVIFQIVKERIDAKVQIYPFVHRITEFSLIVTEEAPYSMSQKDIFNQKKEEKDESFFHLVSRIATKLGNKSVFFAKIQESYMPEKNWRRVPELKKQEPITDILPQRPLRLFEKPIPIRFIDNRIRWRNSYEEIVNHSEKEVILADWWESPIERMYFKITTKSGKEFWIYRTSKGHFLHGVFD